MEKRMLFQKQFHPIAYLSFPLQFHLVTFVHFTILEKISFILISSMYFSFDAQHEKCFKYLAYFHQYLTKRCSILLQTQSRQNHTSYRNFHFNKFVANALPDNIRRMEKQPLTSENEAVFQFQITNLGSGQTK